MATAASARKAAPARPGSAEKKPARPRGKEYTFEWAGKDRTGKAMRGYMRAGSINQVPALLRRQGIIVSKVTKKNTGSGKAIKPKDIAIFTRQLSTMMKAGVPLLQSFDIVGRGSANPRLSRLLADIRGDIETGTSLSAAFHKHPLYFNDLYCNLIAAGESAGILEAIMDRLATYMEKTEAIKSKIKSALMYPIAVVVVSVIVVAVIMIWVIPAFKDVFSSMGANLPAPTLMVMAVSEFFVAWWYILFPSVIGGIWFFLQAWKRSPTIQSFMDRSLLKMPIFGVLVEKSCVARWTRTLATMFAAGVPLVEALDSVGGASGNVVFANATEKIQKEVATGTSLTIAMTDTKVFPTMVIQMAAIGEEAGSLDHMLGKSADFYEQEVDDMVAGMSSLMEPIIIVFLGGIIGAIVVAMYLPIFNLGNIM